MISGLLGLRVDVDTHDGMRDGVPRLLEVMAAEGVKATFYFSMGPDRSGLAVLNALRPGFLKKMTRTGAARVYGWRTVLSGTLLPSRPIGTAFPEIARRTRDEGHETGVHAWDHRQWQDRLLRFPPEKTAEQLDRGFRAYEQDLRRAAAHLRRARLAEQRRRPAPRGDLRPRLRLGLPGDRAVPPDRARQDLEDSAGAGDPSHPRRGAGRHLRRRSPPTSPPWSRRRRAPPGRSSPSTPSWKGGPYAEDFRAFLRRAREAGLRCVPMGELLAERQRQGPLAACAMHHAPVRGRHGVLSTQGDRAAA